MIFYSLTGCRRLKNTSGIDLPEVFFNCCFICLTIVLYKFGTFLDFVGTSLENVWKCSKMCGKCWKVLGLFWECFGTFLEHVWICLENVWEQFVKFWEHVWTNFDQIFEQIEILFFFELTIFRYPKYFLTDLFFYLLYPVVCSRDFDVLEGWKSSRKPAGFASTTPSTCRSSGC